MLAKFRGGTAELQTEAGRWHGALSSLRTVLPDCRDSTMNVAKARCVEVDCKTGPEEPVRLLRFWPDQYLKLQQYFLTKT